MSDFKNIQELEKRLWNAADELRANTGLTSQEYSRPVLGLIPKGWGVSELSDIIDFWNGKKCTKSDDGEFPIYGANGIIGLSDEPRYENGIIIGRVGAYCGAVEYCFGKFWGSDNTIAKVLM